MRKQLIIALILFLLPGQGEAQIDGQWLDSTVHGKHDMGYFFTNRPLINSDEGVVDFRNRWTRQTGNLHFCLYDYDSDSILLKYRAAKTCDKKVYPTEHVEDNIFYEIYNNLRLKRDIRNLIFVVPGYAKTFDEQIKSFMFRIQQSYSDSLKGSTAVVLFAWGDQSMGQFYYKGKRSANRAANDFSIFQHMLESFQADSAFFEGKPNDLSYTLLCTSMGNQILKRYMIKRERQEIDLVKAYDRIVMIGSDAGCDSFEDGKGFHNITAMTDYVSILVNRKDGPLTLSQYMNMKNRLGKAGPTNLRELPENIKVWDVTGVIAWEDLPAMGHDYLLRNSEIRDQLLYKETKFQQMRLQQ
ncbi:MAG: alpha/beta hydrolase [Bacteroidales bacterium]|nr:alpha/beta hydrolase [Bacteroidales bacterium]